MKNSESSQNHLQIPISIPSTPIISINKKLSLIITYILILINSSNATDDYKNSGSDWTSTYCTGAEYDRQSPIDIEDFKGYVFLQNKQKIGHVITALSWINP